ncbi:MAG: HPF/RaiA family ribosome-associated protein [Magnetococcus sp. DMHC-6]
MTTRLESLDKRFGPLTYARVSVEIKPHHNEQRAVAIALVNLAGNTITATKESATVVAAIYDALDTLTNELKDYVEKTKKVRRS